MWLVLGSVLTIASSKTHREVVEAQRDKAVATSTGKRSTSHAGPALYAVECRRLWIAEASPDANARVVFIAL